MLEMGAGLKLLLYRSRWVIQSEKWREKRIGQMPSRTDSLQ